MENLVKRYLAAWNEADAGARAEAVAELWAEDGAYTDPLAAVTGHEAIAAVIAGAREMFPGMVFTPGEMFETHHNVARFTWHLGAPGAEPIADGFDVAELDEDGRIRRVLGFFDRVPA
ncbi:nuclear transport factor 2 family protein [Nonomuraea sp. NPDC050790]|uniref:nuclear transport factor 2 family protein n=1 Tax=Nonomuraea sp. NPDC050790 TaxID=3364371 RepID=UPI003794D8D9